MSIDVILYKTTHSAQNILLSKNEFFSSKFDLLFKFFTVFRSHKMRQTHYTTEVSKGKKGAGDA